MGAACSELSEGEASAELGSDDFSVSDASIEAEFPSNAGDSADGCDCWTDTSCWIAASSTIYECIILV